MPSPTPWLWCLITNSMDLYSILNRTQTQSPIEEAMSVSWWSAENRNAYLLRHLRHLRHLHHHRRCHHCHWNLRTRHDSRQQSMHRQDLRKHSRYHPLLYCMVWNASSTAQRSCNLSNGTAQLLPGISSRSNDVDRTYRHPHAPNDYGAFFEMEPVYHSFWPVDKACRSPC